MIKIVNVVGEAWGQEDVFPTIIYHVIVRENGEIIDDKYIAVYLELDDPRKRFEVIAESETMVGLEERLFEKGYDTVNWLKPVKRYGM